MHVSPSVYDCIANVNKGELVERIACFKFGGEQTWYVEDPIEVLEYLITHHYNGDVRRDSHEY